jgi:hypothetical protein
LTYKIDKSRLIPMSFDRRYEVRFSPSSESLEALSVRDPRLFISDMMHSLGQPLWNATICAMLAVAYGHTKPEVIAAAIVGMVLTSSVQTAGIRARVISS